MGTKWSLDLQKDFRHCIMANLVLNGGCLVVNTGLGCKCGTTTPDRVKIMVASGRRLVVNKGLGCKQGRLVVNRGLGSKWGMPGGKQGTWL